MSDRPQRESTREVAIPERVALTVEHRIAHTEFDSVDDYVAVALELLLRELGRTDDPDERERGTTAASTPSGSDAEEVRDRLDALGYL